MRRGTYNLPSKKNGNIQDFCGRNRLCPKMKKPKNDWIASETAKRFSGQHKGSCDKTQQASPARRFSIAPHHLLNQRQRQAPFYAMVDARSLIAARWTYPPGRYRSRPTTMFSRMELMALCSLYYVTKVRPQHLTTCTFFEVGKCESRRDFSHCDAVQRFVCFSFSRGKK
jgi:hypothetical protein